MKENYVATNLEQNFTDAEKLQARTNIGAAPASAVLPPYASGDGSKALCVNSEATGLEWDNCMKGAVYVPSGSSYVSKDIEFVRLNLADAMKGLVRVRPEGGSVMMAGWLVPEAEAFTEDQGYYPTYVSVGDSFGIKWRKDPMDIEQLTKVTRNYSASTTVELNIKQGEWYECTVDDNNVIVRIALETNSKETIHTLVLIKAASTASTSWANLDYFLENSRARYLACDLSSTTGNPTERIFDVYIKGGFTVGGVPRSFCRVQELEPWSLVSPYGS